MAGLPKILIIEDNPQLREIYTILLESSGYTVIAASDGPRGLEECRANQPDVIFLDIMMPGMSGLEVLDILRAKPEYNGQKAKIALLTNLGHDDRIEEAWRKKADGYVVKADINATDLIDVINSLMSAERVPENSLEAPPAASGDEPPQQTSSAGYGSQPAAETATNNTQPNPNLPTGTNN